MEIISKYEKLTPYGPDRLCLLVVTENSSLSYSSFHLELVFSENSKFFACYLSNNKQKFYNSPEKLALR